MDDREAEELMEDVASVMKSLVSSAVQPLMAEIARLNTLVADMSRALPDAAQIVRDSRAGLADAARVEAVERDLAAARAEIATEREARAAIPAAEPLPDVAAMVRAEIGVALAPVSITASMAMTTAEKAITAAGAAQGRADATAGQLGQLVADAVSSVVYEAVAAIPTPAPGKDADPVVTAQLVRGEVAKAVAAVPVPKDGVGLAGAFIARDGGLVLTLSDGKAVPLGTVVGRDADPEEIAELVTAAVARAVAAIPPAPALPDIPEMVDQAVAAKVANISLTGIGGITREQVRDFFEAVNKDFRQEIHLELPVLVKAAADAIPRPKDGDSVTPDQLAPMVEATVAKAVAALPPPAPGKGVTVDELRPVVEQEVAKAVAALPAPKDGAPGKLPLAKAWDGRVAYEAEVRTHKGALWQAVRDTGREPGHDDWICLAAAGQPGKSADEIEVRGTYDPEASYGRLNIVALNGGAFMSRKADPGPCPGEGWQVIAMRGRPGEPGKTVKGDKGDTGKGPPGPPLVSMSVDGEGLLTAVNGDGSAVECDLYPLLAKLRQ